MKLVFYGRLRDAVGCHELEYSPANDVEDSEALRSSIGAKHPALLGPGIKIALDDQIAIGPTPIAGVREIAFLPPVSGG